VFIRVHPWLISFFGRDSAAPSLWVERSFRLAVHMAVWMLAFAALGACAQSRVIIITPHVDAIRNEFGRGFAEWHARRFKAPAAVEWRNVGGTADSVRFIQSEFSRKPDGIGIDCLFGGGMEPYLLLDDKKLLAAYKPPPEIIDAIP